MRRTQTWAMCLAIFAAALAVLLAAVACGGPASISSGIGGAALPIIVKVELDKYPKLYEPVQVTATLDLLFLRAAPNTEAWISIPQGAVYVSGDLTWSGDLVQGEPVEFSATLAFAEEKGNTFLGASAWAPAPPGSGWGELGGGAAVEFSVRRDRGGAPAPYTTPPPIVWSPKDLEVETVGVDLQYIRDASLLLNRSGQPKFVLINTREQLVQLQSEGLIPSALTRQWRRLAGTDFEQILLIAVYDRARPDSASAPILIHQAVREKATGVVRLSAFAHEVPPETPRASRPVSAVQIYRVHKSNFKYVGEHIFQFDLNGTPVARESLWVDRVVPVPPEPPAPMRGGRTTP